MSAAGNCKKRKPASDTDSDEEDEAQMRQFLEAADHTLLTNDMFQRQQKSHVSSTLLPVDAPSLSTPPVAAQQEMPRSERYLDTEHMAVGSDLQISEHMQTHIWRKLSAIIETQIEFCEPKIESNEESQHMEPINQVKLVANADCYISNEIKPEKLPQKKPTIKRRQLEEEPQDRSSIVVSGEFILSGQDMECWAKRKPRKHKLFEYKSYDDHGHKLQAIEPTNEFSALRRKNKWNESKICQKKIN
ncbi:uncharacterized protein LOC117793820 [Drosophila innubila]|uniref:uncharacterized protein LOC117793820 n=1 Tax=Drosophila innubila TaxID=198719 RepID=UPI00148B4789|nr:uncharacterized protein LOC117793820 [Drosophila innubila]